MPLPITVHLNARRHDPVQLIHLLRSRAVAAGTDPNSVAALFAEFEKSGLNVKGATSSGYSQRGGGADVTAGVDWGEMFSLLPGIASLETQVSGSYDRAQRQLIAVQREPVQLPGFQNNRPIAWLRLRGRVSRLKVSLKVGLELGLPPGEADDGGEEPEERLYSLGVSAETSAAYQMEWLYLVAHELVFVQSATSPALLHRFGEALDERDKKQVKEEAAALLKATGQPALKPEKSLFGGLGTYVTDDLVNKLAWHLSVTPTDARAQQLYLKLIRIQESDKTRVKDDAQDFLRRYYPQGEPVRLGRVSTQDLKRALEQYVQQVGPDPRFQILVDLATQHLIRLGELVDATGESDWQQECFLRLAGHQGGVEAEAGVSAGLSIGSVGLGGGVKALGNASVARTTYRFQCWTPNLMTGQKLFTTQDTVLSYRQIEVGTESRVAGSYVPPAATMLEEKEMEAQRGNNAIKACHALVWKTSILCWYPPLPGQSTVTAQAGSGLCLGVSVRLDRLREKATYSRKDKYFSKIARSLGVSLPIFRRFLAEAPWMAQPDFAPPNGVILLESTWAAPGFLATVQPRPRTVGVWEVTPTLLETHFRNFQAGRAPFTLEAITCRVREADLLGRSSTVFRLGVNYVARIGIALRRTSEAGLDSTLDLHTWWANPAPADDGTRFEQAVPRTVLLHQ